jgi:hypothetical protein
LKEDEMHGNEALTTR